MPNAPTPDERSPAARFRERVAALIAGLIILGSVVLMVCTFSTIGEKEKFERAKDLLLIINPILGVVIGYYFNKVSTEARAESAESTARAASETAREASEARYKAEQVADAASGEAQDARTHLEDVSQAAEKLLAQPPSSPAGTLRASEPDRTAGDARSELEAALARAKSIRGKTLGSMAGDSK